MMYTIIMILVILLAIPQHAVDNKTFECELGHPRVFQHECARSLLFRFNDKANLKSFPVNVTVNVLPYMVYCKVNRVQNKHSNLVGHLQKMSPCI